MYYLKVYPKDLGDLGLASMSEHLLYPDENERKEEYKKRCEEMKEQIRRHVPHVLSVEMAEDI